jgi:hypothetical protein
MSRTPSTPILWRVQVRASKAFAWKNKSGLFETKKAAIEQAAYLRQGRMRSGELVPGTAYGRGNVRVIKHVKGQKA